MSDYLTVFTNLPDEDAANKLAMMIIEHRLAACTNIIPSIHSVYWWKDKIQKKQESTLVIKTNSKCYSKLEELIHKNHPYELPEIIALPIVEALPAYLSWISEQTML